MSGIVNPGGSPHAVSHQNNGSDEISVAGLSGLLADPQTPVAHGHAQADVTGLVADLAAKEATANKNLPSGYPGLSAGSKISGAQQTYGTVADTAAVGNDVRLSDARTPLAHAASHQNGGGDEISVVGLSGLLADDQTPLTHNILTKHNGFPGGTSTFLRADGTFASPTASVADPNPQSYTPGSFTVDTGKYVILSKTLNLTTIQRVTAVGTARVRMT